MALLVCSYCVWFLVALVFSEFYFFEKSENLVNDVVVFSFFISIVTGPAIALCAHGFDFDRGVLFNRRLKTGSSGLCGLLSSVVFSGAAGVLNPFVYNSLSSFNLFAVVGVSFHVGLMLFVVLSWFMFTVEDIES